MMASASLPATIAAKRSFLRLSKQLQHRTNASLSQALSYSTALFSTDASSSRRNSLNISLSFPRDGEWKLLSRRRPPHAHELLKLNNPTLCLFFSTTTKNNSLSSERNKNPDKDNNPNNNKDSSVDETDNDNKFHAQPFVQTRLQSGEWDRTMTNPLYNPKFKSRAKIWSAEDFANRPKVGFSGEFQSFQDAMVTLSWLDDGEQKQIYQFYLELMKHAHEKYHCTSHEYVCRVIAQKFNLTAERVAGVIQLQHNEAQYKKQGDRPLLEEAAAYMDRAYKREILDAYQTFRQKKPDEFVEDPVGVDGKQDSKTYTTQEDLLDVDQMLEDTVVREDQKARMIIDEHVYVEDVHEQDISIPLDKDAKQLLDRRRQWQQQQQEMATAKTTTPWPKQKRPRWNFVAQTVNTRALKKARAKNRSYTNNSPINTLVEDNSNNSSCLRAATMADVTKVSWKPVRNVMEHTYQGAKEAWLDCTLNNNRSAWGKAPLSSSSTSTRGQKEQEKVETSRSREAKNDDDDDVVKATTDNNGDDDSSSSSSSDDEGSGTSDEETSEEESGEEETQEELDEEDEEDDDDKVYDNDKDDFDK